VRPDVKRAERIEAMLADIPRAPALDRGLSRFPDVGRRSHDRRRDRQAAMDGPGRGRRLKAFEKAKTEAEAAGHRGPIDDFVRRLKAGEFERDP
jgi:hypothetical protein